MAISFPKISTFDLDHYCVSFPIDSVAGRHAGRVSVEVLQDRFGLRTVNNRDAVDTFEANRGTFEAKVRDAYDRGAAGDVSLTNADF